MRKLELEGEDDLISVHMYSIRDGQWAFDASAHCNNVFFVDE